MDIFGTRDNRYGIGVHGAGKFLPENVLPRLLFGKPKSLRPIIGALSTLPVKKSGLGLHNIVTSEKEKYNSLLHASGKLIGAVKGEWYFKLSIISGRLKGRGGMVKNIGMPQIKQKSRESETANAPSKNDFPMHQIHGCLDERMGYHSYWYSTSCNGISRFFVLDTILTPLTSKKM